MLFRESLQKYLRQLILPAGQTQLKQMEAYYRLLVEVNRSLNLTRIVEEQEAALKHFADSLLPLTFVRQTSGKALDLGTGAGFPGIPLKIMRPGFEMTLLDATAKKIAFVQRSAKEIGLNVRCIAGRAEELAHTGEFREQFDFVVSRAVGRLPMLLELAAPFLKLGAVFLAYKAQEAEAELQQAQSAMKTLHCRLEENHQVILDGQMRSILVFSKERNTPDKYPRIFSQIRAKPL